MMPMVDTSVAVAIPSTTALRMIKGSASAGSAISSRRSTSAGGVRLTWLRSSWR